MPEHSLSESLQENLSCLNSIFGASADFYTKQIQLGQTSCAIVLFTGISSPEKLWIMVLDALHDSRIAADDGPALLEYLIKYSAVPVESTPILSLEDLCEKLTNGMSVLLLDGCTKALAISTQDMPQRAISPPTSEGDMRGSQEAFTELLRSNVALLRRQFRAVTFTVEIQTAKTPAKTEYAICYDSAATAPELVNTIRSRLSKISLPVLLDSAYFASFLKQDKLNLFPAAAYTERPATACARLCEGKVVILVSGSPTAMILPSFFSEHFESLDDYSSGAVFAGMIRILKYIAFFLSVFGPGLYVMAVRYAPETIPIELLTKLAQAESSTPLPLTLEMLGITLLLEIVREAGLRAPKSIGHTVSLVGALIVGETAVSAGIVSTPVLTMAAAATVATLAVPSLYEQSILFRFLVILLAGIFGLPGLASGALVLLAMTCGTEPFGYDYLYPLIPPGPAAWHDGVIRAIWSTLARKGYQVKQNERKTS